MKNILKKILNKKRVAKKAKVTKKAKIKKKVVKVKNIKNKFKSSKVNKSIKNLKSSKLNKNIAKKNVQLYGINDTLVQWRKLDNSLSSNTIQKLRDGFKVYNKYMNYNKIISIPAKNFVLDTINIDLDFHTIDLFNYIRKRDENINIAISDEEGEFDLYYFHNRSALNSLNVNRKKNAKEIKKVKTKTLNSIIENSKFQKDKINLLSIDVEGHELEVIKSIDLIKYSPEIILIEFMEKKLNEIKFYKQNINSIIDSDLYKYMIKNNYYFVNWIIMI